MLRHIVTDLHGVYLREFEAQLGKTPTKPQLAKKAPQKEGGDKSDAGGSPDEKIKKQARQLAYDTRYKSRREGIPLERAWSQVLQNSSASAPVKELAKGMVFGGSVKEDVDGNINEADDNKKEMVLVTPVKGYGKPYRRYATLKKKYELRRNPQIQSVVGTSYGTPYEGEKKKGEQTAAALQHKTPEKKAKKDYDGDGKVESGAKEYRGAVHNAIQRKKGGKPDGKDTSNVKESFSNWREDLIEVADILDNQKDQKKISEKKVNNKIKINPDIKETVSLFGGELIDVQEITEDYLNESIDIASEYFYQCGLNEYGLDMVIEELGLEKFTDFVFYISEDYELTEARRSGRIEPVTKGGKSVGSLKGGAKTAAINRLRKEKQAARSGEGSNSKSLGMTAALRSQSSVAKKIATDKGKKAVEKAKEAQGSKKPLKDRIAKGVLGAVKAYQQGMERHKAATATAGKALKVAAKGASEFGKGVASGVKATGTAAKKVKKAVVGEAVYGGTKPEPKDTRMTVTASDKKANTKAWQNYKAGHPSYKAAPHLDEEESDRMRDRQLERGGMGARSSTSPERRSSAKPQTDAERKASMEKYKKTSKDALDLVRKSMGKGLMQQYEPEGNIIGEAKKMKGEDPCWKGYQMVGTKKKRGKEVPNCVPKEEVSLDEKITSKTSKEKIISDFVKSNDPKFSGDTKKERINRALGAWYAMHRNKSKVTEAISTVTGQQGSEVANKQKDTERKQMLAAQQKLMQKKQMLQRQQFQQQKQGKLPLNYGEDIELNDEVIDEKTRYAKETGVNYRKQKPQPEGGSAKSDKAFQSVSKMMRNMSGGRPAGQRPKVKGKKPPEAGKYGSERESPAQTVAKRRAAAQRAQDMMHSRFD
jgi:hypothetical protein